MTTATALLQVLLVEDDLGDVALMECSFAEHQVATELHHVADGAEALAFLRREGGYADAPRPDAYVTKPIDLDDFDRAVAQIRNFYGHTVTLPRRPRDATPHDGSAADPTKSTPPA